MFFQFFKVLVFRVVWWVKGQKIVQNDKNCCLLHSISQEPYIKWLSFMVHMCKMIISPWLFFIFSKFSFFGLLGSKRAKNGPNWQKNLSITLYISRTIIWLLFILHLCKIIISPGVFFIFSKFWFFGFWRGKSIKNGQNDKKFSRLEVTLHFSGTIHQMIVIYGTHVSNDSVSRCFFQFLKFWFSGLSGRPWQIAYVHTRRTRNQKFDKSTYLVIFQQVLSRTHFFQFAEYVKQL